MPEPRQAPSHQLLGPCPWPFPLAPHNAAQLAPHPAIEFLEYPLDLGQPEVADPATQDRDEGLDGARHGLAAARPDAPLSLSRNRATLLGATLRRGSR